MGSASITIKVDGKWAGGPAISAAQASLKGLATTATASAEGVSKYFDRQQKNAERLSRLAASTVKSTTSDLASLGNSLVQTGGRIYDVGKGLEEVGDTLTRSVTVPLVDRHNGSDTLAVDAGTGGDVVNEEDGLRLVFLPDTGNGPKSPHVGARDSDPGGDHVVVGGGLPQGFQQFRPKLRSEFGRREVFERHLAEEVHGIAPHGAQASGKEAGESFLVRKGKSRLHRHHEPMTAGKVEAPG